MEATNQAFDFTVLRSDWNHYVRASNACYARYKKARQAAGGDASAIIQAREKMGIEQTRLHAELRNKAI